MITYQAVMHHIMPSNDSKEKLAPRILNIWKASQELMCVGGRVGHTFFFDSELLSLYTLQRTTCILVEGPRLSAGLTCTRIKSRAATGISWRGPKCHEDPSMSKSNFVLVWFQFDAYWHISCSTEPSWLTVEFIRTSSSYLLFDVIYATAHQQWFVWPKPKEVYH